jgi:hypothetical protein
MDASQIVRRAEEMGIEPGSVAEADLVRAIQRAEGNEDCYATDVGTGRVEKNDAYGVKAVSALKRG